MDNMQKRFLESMLFCIARHYNGQVWKKEGAMWRNVNNIYVNDMWQELENKDYIVEDNEGNVVLHCNATWQFTRYVWDFISQNIPELTTNILSTIANYD